MVAMAPPEGEEEKSQAYYVIRAAQDKEDLQRHGDELDARIRKAEKEIQALENTLRVLNSRNETYRRNFNKARVRMFSSTLLSLHIARFLLVLVCFSCFSVID